MDIDSVSARIEGFLYRRSFERSFATLRMTEEASLIDEVAEANAKE